MSLKKYVRTRIYPYRKIYFTIDEAASIIGMAPKMLSIYLTTDTLPAEQRPRVDYYGNLRLTDIQVSELHKRILEAKKKQETLFQEPQ